MTTPTLDRLSIIIKNNNSSILVRHLPVEYHTLHGRHIWQDLGYHLDPYTNYRDRINPRLGYLNDLLGTQKAKSFGIHLKTLPGVRGFIAELREPIPPPPSNTDIHNRIIDIIKENGGNDLDLSDLGNYYFFKYKSYIWSHLGYSNKIFGYLKKFLSTKTAAEDFDLCVVIINGRPYARLGCHRPSPSPSSPLSSLHPSPSPSPSPVVLPTDESETMEWKKAVNFRSCFSSNVAKYLTAFLNSSTGGTIIFGVTDNGTVIGDSTLSNRDSRDKVRLRIDTIMNQVIQPRVSPELVKVTFPVFNSSSSTPPCLQITIKSGANIALFSCSHLGKTGIHFVRFNASVYVMSREQCKERREAIKRGMSTEDIRSQLSAIMSRLDSGAATTPTPSSTPPPPYPGLSMVYDGLSTMTFTVFNFLFT